MKGYTLTKRRIPFEKNEKINVSYNPDGTGGFITIFEANDNKKKLSELEPGTVFSAGDKNFTVLEQFENTTAVVEAGELESRKFDNDSNNWGSSDFRIYLNIEALCTYEDLFGKDNIVETETDLTSLDGLNDYGKCDDKIRLMTFEEYRKYQFLFKRNEKWEWLVTPWSTSNRVWRLSVCAVSC